jgi:hypothetical protein|tara:strand:- start:833 stop:1480 length:648 start_codon:yes stop_codon:yes gene_type:complete
MVGQHSAMISILLTYLTLYQSRLQNLNNKDNMKHINKIFLILFAGLLVAQCSTYSMKSDMTKNGVINKTPKWYVKYPHTTKKHYQEAASAVSPDLELAVKKATLLAKAKLADRINGEMNNRSTINKNEAGTNESMTVTGQAQDIIVNVINDTLVRHYEVDKQVIYTTKNKSYRVYVMVKLGKDHVDAIVSELKQTALATTIDATEIDKAAEKVLN